MESTSMTPQTSHQSSVEERDPSCSISDASQSQSAGNAELRDARRLPPEGIYDPIAASLRNVERILQSELQSRYESISPLLRHGIQLGGKRMRPALVLLSGQAIGQMSPADARATPGLSELQLRQLETLAAVLEMVHTATLVHDDVLDGAETRRHVRSVNDVWGDHASILLGDYLFSQAFRLSATLDSTLACQWIGEAARLVCEGELRQVLARNVLDLDETSYLEMIRGKTAQLCSVACRLGSVYAGGDHRATQAMSRYGESLGIAFQIADDFLDLWGSPDTVGKTLGTDLEQGKWTLPVLRLLTTASGRDLSRIRSILAGPGDQRYTRLTGFLDRCDAREYTLAVAARHRDQALASLDCFPESSAVLRLKALAKFAIDRAF